MHGIDGDEAQSEIVVEVAVGGDVTAPAFQAHFHVQLPAFADGRDVDVLVENFHVAIGFDHARGDDARLIRAQVDGLGAIAAELERDLLQVQDDVGRILHHAGDGLELVQHALDLDGRDGGAFDRRQHDAAQRVADGGAKATFERLRPEHAVLVGQVRAIGGETFRFLKTFPKHACCSSRPCCSVRHPQDRPRSGSGAGTGLSGSK